MHQHDVDVVGQHGQSQAHRLLPGLTPGHDVQLGLAGHRVQQGADTSLFAGRCGDDDDVDRASLRERPDGVGQQRLTGELAQSLGLTGPEPLTAAGSRDDGGRPHRAGSTSCLFMETGSPTGRANTKRPLAVVSTLVTWTSSS